MVVVVAVKGLRRECRALLWRGCAGGWVGVRICVCRVGVRVCVVWVLCVCVCVVRVRVRAGASELRSIGLCIGLDIGLASP